MSVLEWDKSGERRFEAGVKHGVLYVASGTGYADGVVWNGLTSVSESPEGAEPTDLWADDMKYASFRSAETFGATIEAYTYPDEFAECDGSAMIVPGVYVGQQGRKKFGFSFTTEVGDDTNVDMSSLTNYKIHIIWGASASPSERSYETINDSPDAITFSWEITTTPVNVGPGYRPTSSMVIDATKLKTVAEKAALTTLEGWLYGTENTEARLPDPSEIIDLFSSTSV